MGETRVTGTDPLSSWRDGAAKSAIVDFVAQVAADGVPVDERIAVFDADGTLWCEQPAPAQAGFILRRLAEMAEADPSLRARQPWQAAYERDFAWLVAAVEEHYAGDDTKARVLLGGVGAAFDGVDVEAFVAQSGAFLRAARHPTLGRAYTALAYQPMLELLRYLEANGFSTLIVSGSGGDFMRSVAKDVFGVPRERVIGSSAVLEYASDGAGGTIAHRQALAVLDDGPQKPVQIWSRLGRRPLLAGGNSNGDLPMLEFAHHPDRPTLRLLVDHDDAEREFAYRTGAERAFERARERGWIVASMKDDFATVFGE